MQIRLHREHFRHTVRYGRSRRKHYAFVAAVQFVDVFDFELKIARSRAGGVGNTRYVVHLRKQEQVFIRVRFVHKEIINAEFLKDKHVVFLRFVEQLFELRFTVFLDTLQVLNRA